LVLVRSAWLWLWGVESRREMFPTRYTWVIPVVFIAYWVLRNVPVYPFSLLAPHEIGP
jgi:hypothetical protein